MDQTEDVKESVSVGFKAFDLSKTDVIAPTKIRKAKHGTALSSVLFTNSILTC